MPRFLLGLALLLAPALSSAYTLTITLDDQLVADIRPEYAVEGVPADDARLQLLIAQRVTTWWTQILAAHLSRDAQAVQDVLDRLAPARRAQVQAEIAALQAQMRALVQRETPPVVRPPP